MSRLILLSTAHPAINATRDFAVEMVAVSSLKELSDELLDDDAGIVVIDCDCPLVDPREAVRLVKGTRWDVQLIVIGDEAARQRIGDEAEVLDPDAWGDLLAHLSD